MQNNAPSSSDGVHVGNLRILPDGSVQAVQNKPRRHLPKATSPLRTQHRGDRDGYAHAELMSSSGDSGSDEPLDDDAKSVDSHLRDYMENIAKEGDECVPPVRRIAYTRGILS
jgi:hypothetical protein